MDSIPARCRDENGYLVRQSLMTDVPYGRRTVARAGCGFLAVYNAARFFGLPVRESEMCIRDSPAHRADLRDGQDGADLVVGVHDRNQARILADGALDLLRRHGTNGADGEKLDGEALFFKLFQRVQHGVVLERGRNDVLFAFAFAKARGGEDGLIVGLAAAGGEVNFCLLYTSRCV